MGRNLKSHDGITGELTIHTSLGEKMVVYRGSSKEFWLGHEIEQAIRRAEQNAFNAGVAMAKAAVSAIPTHRVEAPATPTTEPQEEG